MGETCQTQEGGFARDWRCLLQSLPDHVAVIDLEGDIQLINRPFPGVTAEKMLGSKLCDWVAPEHRQEVRAAAAGARREARTTVCEAGLMSSRGSAGWYSFRIAPIVTEDSVASLVVVGVDITDRKQTEAALRASEANYRAILDGAADAIFVHEIETGRILDVNAKMFEMFGYTAEEVQKLDVGDLSSGETPYTQEDAAHWIKEAAAGGTTVFEWRARHKNGRLFWVEVNLRQCVIGGRDRILAVVRDIDERKKAEERLRLLSSAVEQSSEGVAVSDLSGNLLFVNRAFAEMHGYSPQELAGKHLSVFHSTDQLPKVNATIQQVMEVGGFTGEIWHVRRDGDAFPTLMSNSLLFDEAGEARGMVGTCRDITSDKRAGEALRESERRLATLMGNLPGMAYRCRNDPDWTMEFVSDGCIELTGYEVADLVKSEQVSYAELIHPDDRQMIWDLVQEALAMRAPFQLIYRIRTASGEVRWVWEQGQGVFGEDEQLIALEGFISDITDRQRAERALKESEERFRRLSGAAYEGIFIHDRGTVLDVNERAARMFGYEPHEIIGVSVFDLTAPESLELVKAKVMSGDEEPYEAVVLRKDGSHFLAEIFGQAIPYEGRVVRVAAVRDITERKGAEEATRDREARLRLMLEQMPAVVWVVDTELRFTSSQGSALKGLRLEPDEVTGRTLFEYCQTDDGDLPIIAAHRRALKGESVEYEMPWEGRVFASHVEPLRDSAGDIIGCVGVALDVTERKRAEEEILARARAERLLLRELDHRVRNNLAALESLTNLTAGSTDDVKEFAESMGARVRAMAAVHGLLSTNRWQPVRLRSLIEALLTPDARGRIELAGPAVEVPAAQAQALGMVINELMINCHKHGVHLTPDGRVKVGWSAVTSDDGEPGLTLDWQESGGPVIESEPEAGVGTALIVGLVKSELRGRAELTFPREGANHRFQFVLSGDPPWRSGEEPGGPTPPESG
ncbi:MAG: PAS domain S-box protein [Phycisphaerales bacterium]|nr:MAG: PAS domain S-box protein [Phycisphaerales bacterium]